MRRQEKFIGNYGRIVADWQLGADTLRRLFAVRISAATFRFRQVRPAMKKVEVLR
jgi:hypothetical protein